jgi:hypothetical protein
LLLTTKGIFKPWTIVECRKCVLRAHFLHPTINLGSNYYSLLKPKQIMFQLNKLVPLLVNAKLVDHNSSFLTQNDFFFLLSGYCSINYYENNLPVNPPKTFSITPSGTSTVSWVKGNTFLSFNFFFSFCFLSFLSFF